MGGKEREGKTTTKSAHGLEIMSKQLTTLVSFIIAAKRTHDEKQLQKQRETMEGLARGKSRGAEPRGKGDRGQCLEHG